MDEDNIRETLIDVEYSIKQITKIISNLKCALEGIDLTVNKELDKITEQNKLNIEIEKKYQFEELKRLNEKNL